MFLSPVSILALRAIRASLYTLSLFFAAMLFVRTTYTPAHEIIAAIIISVVGAVAASIAIRFNNPK